MLVPRSGSWLFGVKNSREETVITILKKKKVNNGGFGRKLCKKEEGR